MDVLYIVKENKETDSEDLRYSLRSISNLSFNKVIIAGEKPVWVKNVDFLPVDQNKSKGENWMMNLRAALNSKLVSDDFILMNDDFFIMKKLDELPNLNFGPMKSVIEMYKNRYPDGSNYIDNMMTLYEILLKEGFNNPISYELHTPMILNRQKIYEMFERVGANRLYQFRTRYGNYFNIGGQEVKDVKIFKDFSHNDLLYVENPNNYLSSQVFLSTTGGSFKDSLVGDYIRKSFPDKSIYEV